MATESTHKNPFSASGWCSLPSCVLQKVFLGLGKGCEDIMRLVCRSWYAAHSQAVLRLAIRAPTQHSGDGPWLQLDRMADAYPNLRTLDLRDAGRGKILAGDPVSALDRSLRNSPKLECLVLPRGPAVTFEWLRGLAMGGKGLRSLSLHGVSELCPWGAAMIGAGLVGLTALDLSYISNLADGALVHLQGLSHLKTLSISGCRLLTGEGLKHLGPLPLSKLEAAACHATGSDGFVSMLTCRGALAYNLTELDISGDFNLEEGHLSALGTLPNLTELRLIGRHLTGFEKLAGATSMKRLDLGRCRWVDDNSLLALSAMHHMEELDLSMAEQVTSKGLEVVGHWPSMSRLTLANACKVTDAAFSLHICYCTSMVSLVVRKCHLLSDTSAIALQGLRNLECLVFEECPQVTDDGMSVALSSMDKLRRLSLSKCPLIGNKCLRAAAQASPELNDVCISHCAGVADDGIARLAALQGLDHLDMRAVGRVTDRGLQELVASGGANLKTLKLGWCREVTDDALETVAASCKDLQKLELYRLPCVTDRGVDALRNSRPKLELRMYKCSKVSSRDR